MKKFLSLILCITMILSTFVFTVHSEYGMPDFQSYKYTPISMNEEIVYSYNGEIPAFSFNAVTPYRDIILYTKNVPSDFVYSVTKLDSFFHLISGSTPSMTGSQNAIRVNYVGGIEKYYIVFNCQYDKKAEFTVGIMEDFISSLEFEEFPLMWSENGEIFGTLEGLKIKINYYDPSRESKIVTFDGSSNSMMVDGFEMTVTPEVLSSGHIQLTVRYVIDFLRDIIDYSKNVTTFRIVTPPTKTVYYQDIDSNYYHQAKYCNGYCECMSLKPYYEIDYSGLEIDVYYSDGSKKRLSTETTPYLTRMFASNESEQNTTPWKLGTQQVILTINGVNRAFPVTLKENPYTAAITKQPLHNLVYKYQCGEYIFETPSDTYFKYFIDLTGLEIELTDKEGNTKKILYNAYTAEDFYTADSQNRLSYFGYGNYNIPLFYKGMYVGSYTFTVKDKEIKSYTFATKPALANYYTEQTGEYPYDIDPNNVSVKVNFTDGTTETVPYEDIGKPGTLGVCFYFGVNYDEETKNYYYYVVNYTDEYITQYGYFNKVGGEVTEISIVTPPKNIECFKDYGINAYTLDMTGCMAEISFKNGTKKTWTYSDAFADGEGIFENGVLYWYVYGDSLIVEYRDVTGEYTPENITPIGDISVDTFNKNKSTEIDFSVEQIPVYTFIPWHNGTYSFSVKGDAYSAIFIYDENGNILEDQIIIDHFYEGSPNVTFDIECKKGETYYLVLEELPLTPNIADQKTILTVRHDYFGDANGDCKITTKDVLMIRKYLGGIIKEDELDLTVCDVNGDGIISTKDILAIRKHLGGIIEDLPVQ